MTFSLRLIPDSVSVDGLQLFRVIGNTPWMRELSVAKQRYEAVRAVLFDGETVTDVAARFGVARKTVHDWLRKYEAGGIEVLGNRSHRPRSCPHQMSADVEVMIARLRRAHPSWGPRRLVFELARVGVEPTPSESGVYRALTRLGLVEPDARRPQDRKCGGGGSGAHRWSCGRWTWWVASCSLMGGGSRR